MREPPLSVECSGEERVSSFLSAPRPPLSRFSTLYHDVECTPVLCLCPPWLASPTLPPPFHTTAAAALSLFLFSSFVFVALLALSATMAKARAYLHARERGCACVQEWRRGRAGTVSAV